jgi:hypothetical protein
VCADHVAPVFVLVWDHPVFGPPRPIVDSRVLREGLARLPLLDGAVVAGSGRRVVAQGPSQPA